MHKRIESTARKLRRWWRQLDKKRFALYTGGGLLLILMVLQFAYPADRMLPFATVDGVAVGGGLRVDATKRLNTAYADQTIDIYMGSGKKPVTSPKLSAVDIKVDNKKRLASLDYPWYLRIIPSSILWAGLKSAPVPTPIFGSTFDDYVEKHLMPSCRQEPVDATLKLSGESLIVVPAKKGGQCESAEVMKSLKAIRPVLGEQTKITVTRKEVDARIGDATAKQLADELNTRLKDGLPLTVTNETITIARRDILSWLDFSIHEDAIIPSVSAERAGAWLGGAVASKVAIKPGVSYITTKDFTVISQTIGSSGQALDTGQTIRSLQTVVDGQATSASVVTKEVPPTEQYTRTYSASDTGLVALMENYAKDHPGTFGVSMIELDGKKRRADYRGNEQFVTASTYKLFVAYSLMKRIDAGTRDWESSAACFNKMISFSDNACAEDFLMSIGLKNVTTDIQSIGLKNSTFMKTGGPYTTANDLTLLLGMVATGQNFSNNNQQRLVNAMTANIYRKGIPSGANGTVADKVGFMDGLLHDAAIVYGPNGTYVLAIMTDGSSWASIADLTKQLDTLHAQ